MPSWSCWRSASSRRWSGTGSRGSCSASSRRLKKPPAPRDPVHEGRDPFFSTLLVSGGEPIERFDVAAGEARGGTGAEQGMPVAEREVEPAADRDRAERQPDRPARGGREPDLGAVPGIGPERERLAQTAEIREDGRGETPLEHERQQPPRDLLEKERPR